MTYEEARRFMLGDDGPIYLQLDRIGRLLDAAGHPEKKLRYIHIAGTNGKGSIAAYISRTLTLAGHRTGCYTSPVIYTYGEQFMIDGQMISEKAYTRLAEKLSMLSADLTFPPHAGLSSFELETVMAFLYFLEEGCEYVVLECGMGGASDATNVIPAPLLAVFASISLDHSSFLGNTVREVTQVKSGIIKEGCTVVTSRQSEEVLSVLQEVCREKDCPLVIAEHKEAEDVTFNAGGVAFTYRGTRIRTPLPGLCQIENASVAYEALQCLKEDAGLSEEQILSGIASAHWTGRFSRIAKKPDFIVDGAHNPGAARELCRSVEACYPASKRIFIIGVFADKDYEQVLSVMLPLADQVFTVETPGSARALPAEKLAEAVKAHGVAATACADLAEAVGMAYAAAGDEDLILSFGSLSNVAAITDLVKERKR